MDIDNHFREAMEEPETQTDEDRLKNSTSSTSASDNTTGCFDCNICLDFAQDPIVTLCGHLYCWSCIYKWIRHKNAAPQQCPVCKAALSQSTIVPLYGRGDTSTRTNCGSKRLPTTHLDIPLRPSAIRANALTAASPEPHYPQQQLHQHEPHRYNHNTMSPGGGSPRLFQPMSGAFGGTAIAVLPWVFGYPEASGLYYSNPYYLTGISNSPHLRRQEMQAERSLSRISAFLFCCLVLCLLLF